MYDVICIAITGTKCQLCGKILRAIQFRKNLVVQHMMVLRVLLSGINHIAVMTDEEITLYRPFDSRQSHAGMQQ